MILSLVHKKNADRYNIHRDVRSYFPENYNKRILFNVQDRHVIIASDTKPMSQHVVKSVEIPHFTQGTASFILDANPVVTRLNKRHAITEPSKLADWINRKIECVKITHCEIDHPTKVHIKKNVCLNLVRYYGKMQINDNEALYKTISKGIGPAKGFGFGLLLLNEHLSLLI